MSANLPAAVCPACREYVSWGRCECEPEPVMAEIEHQPPRDCMTGGAAVYVRTGFDAWGHLDAPWLLPLGGVVVHEADGVADCAVEREADDGYDEGEAIGYGSTPRAAVRDLAELRWDEACRRAATSADVRARLGERVK